MAETTHAPEGAQAADEATLSDLIKLNEQRAATYGLLSRLYRVEVDEEFLQELRGMRFPASTGNKNVDEGYRLMAKFMSNVWENSLTDLAVDYVRTFIGHGVDAFSAAYPFESVYTSEKRLLMQEARDEVLAIYRAAASTSRTAGRRARTTSRSSWSSSRSLRTARRSAGEATKTRRSRCSPPRRTF